MVYKVIWLPLARGSQLRTFLLLRRHLAIPEDVIGCHSCGCVGGVIMASRRRGHGCHKIVCHAQERPLSCPSKELSSPKAQNGEVENPCCSLSNEWWPLPLILCFIHILSHTIHPHLHTVHTFVYSFAFVVSFAWNSVGQPFSQSHMSSSMFSDLILKAPSGDSGVLPYLCIPGTSHTVLILTGSQ